MKSGELQSLGLFEKSPQIAEMLFLFFFICKYDDLNSLPRLQREVR
jgi:hypothetical protein